MIDKESSRSGNSGGELDGLLNQLRRVTQRIGELSAGYTDTVMDRSGNILILNHARQHLSNREVSEKEAILGALPAQIALLDRQGCIVSVNEAWRAFAEANSLQDASHGIGVNYLEICAGSKDIGSFEGRRAAKGIRAVLDGTETTFSAEYPCHSPTEQRWFLMTATPLMENGAVGGAVVMHLNITDRKRGEETLRHFSAAMDAVSDAIFLIDRASMRFLHVNDAACQAFDLPRVKMLKQDPWTLLSTTCAELEAAYDKIIESGSPSAEPIELVRRLEDGSEACYELRRHARRLSDRWTIVTLIRDITERKQAELRIKRLNRVHAILGSVNAILVRVKDRAELYQEACRLAVDAGFPFAWFGLCDRETMKNIPAASSGGRDEYLEVLLPYLNDERGLVVRGIRSGVVTVANDLRKGPVPEIRKAALECGFRSKAVLPLKINNSVVGVLVLYAAEFDFFNDDEVELLSELAGNISFAMDHLERAERIQYLAFNDPLTGLANRTRFHELLAESLRDAEARHSTLALAIVDIERFKSINDTLGRRAGDELLKALAARWAKSRAFHRMSRIDADHFAIIFTDVKANTDFPVRIKALLHEMLGPTFRIGNADLKISAKIGIAMFPADGTDGDTLLRNAEAALKKAKVSGARYLFYNRSMNARVAESLTLENRLREALEKEQFVLHYQPKIEVASGTLVGAEALIRWNDPEAGLVPAGTFVPVLEETGLIYEAGRWALKKAIEDYLRWRNAGLPVVRIAVNVSPLQLRDSGFVEEVRRATAVDPAAAAGLELEVTESLIMEDVKHSAVVLTEIRDMGICIAIDDFGTGFSSLSYLSKLPVDILKIDRSFVLGMTASADGLALVSTIINLAHTLKLKVVAEGVETGEQLRILKERHCDEIQGFLVSRAVSAEIFEKKFLRTSGALIQD